MVCLHQTLTSFIIIDKYILNQLDLNSCFFLFPSVCHRLRTKDCCIVCVNLAENFLFKKNLVVVNDHVGVIEYVNYPYIFYHHILMFEFCFLNYFNSIGTMFLPDHICKLSVPF